MTAQEAKQRLERIWKAYTSAYDTVSIEDLMAFDMAINSLGAIEQIQWERDMVIKQLHDLGYGLGEKPRDVPDIHVGKTDSKSETVTNCHDLISKKDAYLALIEKGQASRRYKLGETWELNGKEIREALDALPSAHPETCEGCKHLGKWENEVEYGYPSPCTRCKRRVGDHYER